MSIKCLHSFLKDVLVIGIGAVFGACKKVGLEKYINTIATATALVW